MESYVENMENYLELIENKEFIAAIRQRLNEQISVWGDPARLKIDETAGMVNTLFNTSSGTITVGAYTFTGHNVCIITGTHYVEEQLEKRMDYPREGRDIVIGNGVWLASNCTILGPCTIGDNAVVAAGAVVVPGTTIPPDSIWGNIPARPLKRLPGEGHDDEGVKPNSGNRNEEASENESNYQGRSRTIRMIDKLKRHQFLFSELVKRDFAKKYKRTILGMAWSILSPLMNLLIMWMVFSNFFGNNVNHYVVYLFAGQLVFSYFTDATNLGMNSLVGNAGIFTKVNVPKYLFLLSQNVSSLINFGLTLLIFFTFVAIDGIPFTWKFLLLAYPVGCLIVFNLGIGLILSALFVFFRDMQYLWGILTQLIMWMSAIFYTIDGYSYTVQCAFLLNPLYLFIRYFRKIVIDGTIPTLQFHLLAAGYALAALGIGAYMYKKYNHEFLYYV